MPKCLRCWGKQLGEFYLAAVFVNHLQSHSHFRCQLPLIQVVVVELGVCFSLFLSHFPPWVLCCQVSFCGSDLSTALWPCCFCPARRTSLGSSQDPRTPAAPNEGSTFLPTPPCLRSLLILLRLKAVREPFPPKPHKLFKTTTIRDGTNKRS